MSWGSIGNAEMSAIPRRATVVSPPHRSPTTHPYSQRVQFGQTGQPKNPAPPVENAALLVYGALDSRKKNLMADALSRAPVHLGSPSDELAEVPSSADACVSLLAAITGSDDSLSDLLLKRIALTTTTDPVMKALREVILACFPNDKCNLPLPLHPFGASGAAFQSTKAKTSSCRAPV